METDLEAGGGNSADARTVRARPGRSSALSVCYRESSVYIALLYERSAAKSGGLRPGQFACIVRGRVLAAKGQRSAARRAFADAAAETKRGRYILLEVWRPLARAARGRWHPSPRARSHCRFVLSRIHFIPDFF